MNLHIIASIGEDENEPVENLHILMTQPEEGTSLLEDDVILKSVELHTFDPPFATANAPLAFVI